MVNAMPKSEFIKYVKAARMLVAEKRLSLIEAASFPHYKDKHREDIMRALTRAAKEFIFEPLADFSAVAAKFAKRLNDGR